MSTITRIACAALACELVKVARDEWLTRAEIAERTGAHINTVGNWLPEFVANGIMVERPRTTARSSWLKRPAEYSLSPLWGGQALASPTCVDEPAPSSVRLPTDLHQGD